MKLKNKEVILDGKDGKIYVKRNLYGIPEIKAESMVDISYGLGWVHANDRQLQTLLMRILLKGEAAEHLKGDKSFIEIDKYMRSMNFLPDPEGEIKKLEPLVKRQVLAYARGFNFHLSDNGTISIFRFLGYRPEPWDIKDSLLIGKVFGFIGLADIQGKMEKFLIQIVQNDIEEAKIKELFPYLTEKIDYELMKKVKLVRPLVPETKKWLDTLPGFAASNNWAVSGEHTESGKPILCGDIHLEINRLPSIWQEAVMVLPDNKLSGTSIPGTPGLIIGRTDFITWSPTYSFMDMIDYRIEHCSKGKYKRKNGWKPFHVREEIIRVKKGKPITLKVFENEHGVLEGDPQADGYYLVLSWSAKDNCGANDFNAMFNLEKAKNVREAMDLFKLLDAASFNWVIADRDGNIGYQMSGRPFKRAPGVSGLLPLPAWEKKYDNRGYVEKERLPSLYNPEDGIILTANQDLNHLGSSNPINLPMATYRANRIEMLLREKGKLTVQHMKEIQYDLYSLQAENFMNIIRPLLPDTLNGRILREWDCTYNLDSKGAMLFESVYVSLLKVVFGDNGFGRDVIDYIIKEAGFFNDYYGNLDDIVFKENSAWFHGEKRNQLFKKAIEQGLRVKAKPYGKKRKIIFSHLIFGGKIPRIFGYDYGPIRLPGSRATIPQAQIMKSSGRKIAVAASYRLIADMARGEMHSNMAGGASERRFSRWYRSDIKNWIKGVYKTLN